MTEKDFIHFRDLAGKDHSLKRSLYKGHNTLSGRFFVVFGKHEIEICSCEFKRVFMNGFLGKDYFSSMK